MTDKSAAIEAALAPIMDAYFSEAAAINLTWLAKRTALMREQSLSLRLVNNAWANELDAALDRKDAAIAQACASLGVKL
jgi:hypothetical protein